VDLRAATGGESSSCDLFCIEQEGFLLLLVVTWISLRPLALVRKHRTKMISGGNQIAPPQPALLAASSKEPFIASKNCFIFFKIRVSIDFCWLRISLILRKSLMLDGFSFCLRVKECDFLWKTTS
jgi:hypothetical protein